MPLVATTLDPSNKGGNAALSSGNLTATFSGSANVAATRSAVGPAYFEVVTTSGTPRVGVAQSAPGTSYRNSNLGADVLSLGYDSGGSVYVNGSSVATLASWSAGANIGVAIDTGLQAIWFRVNGGNWNNNASYSPVTGVGGISLSSLLGTNYFPAVGAGGSAACNLLFLAGSWAYSAPSGFSAMSSATIQTGRSSTRRVLHKTPLACGGRTGGVANRYGGIGFTTGLAGSPLGPRVKVSGTVQENGSSAARTVFVYDQNTGALLGKTKSDPTTGAFSLLCLGRGKVFVVALDSPSYQAQVYDNITPA